MNFLLVATWCLQFSPFYTFLKVFQSIPSLPIVIFINLVFSSPFYFYLIYQVNLWLVALDNSSHCYKFNLKQQGIFHENSVNQVCVFNYLFKVFIPKIKVRINKNKKIFQSYFNSLFFLKLNMFFVYLYLFAIISSGFDLHTKVPVHV